MSAMHNMDMHNMSHQAKAQAAKMAAQAKNTTLKLAAAANIPTSLPASNKVMLMMGGSSSRPLP